MDSAAEPTSTANAATVEEVPLLVFTSDDAHNGMTPKAVLFTFTALNFLLYFDRGATAGALLSIREDRRLTGYDYVLSDTKSGLLVSGFTIGYLFTGPILASRGSAWGSRAVLLFGMLMWCVTCLGCAVAFSYWFLLVCRICVGIGEAAFVGFTVTIIDNFAPSTRRTSWIGFFYSMIPVGTAVGMGCSGVLTSSPTLLGMAAWRVLYLGEVVAAFPIINLLWCVPTRYHLPPMEGDATSLTFTAASMCVLRNTNYMLLVFGFATYCFVTGAVSAWGIPLLHEGPLQLSKTEAAIFLGLATTVSGVIGSLLGGLVVDCLGGSAGVRGAIQCQRFDMLMIAIAIPCGIVALLATDVLSFGIAFVAAVLALFAITAPINASILTVVTGELRPYAVSYSVFFIHLLGDFPSPMLTGVMSDYLGRYCHGLAHHCCDFDADLWQCVWVSDAAAGHCTNRLQLRNALLLVFLYLLIAPPCWAAVSWRLGRVAAATAAAEGDAPAAGATAPSSVLSRGASVPSVIASTCARADQRTA